MEKGGTSGARNRRRWFTKTYKGRAVQAREVWWKKRLRRKNGGGARLRNVVETSGVSLPLTVGG
ncbi:hypothetical protein SAMN05421823_101667 [Catalinimonas alkaloidigena]|uniref:Uncharacterized protein n=1 Tax=Catalinimonas alkaloidigena TaxID=1075417 RepID=A0A1G8YGT8_9BACT|nr:hypothetical protein SAMN05421823_101667 [Catalinimonas alkaloidigena]